MPYRQRWPIKPQRYGTGTRTILPYNRINTVTVGSPNLALSLVEGTEGRCPLARHVCAIPFPKLHGSVGLTPITKIHATTSEPFPINRKKGGIGRKKPRWMHERRGAETNVPSGGKFLLIGSLTPPLLYIPSATTHPSSKSLLVFPYI
jgi:hypothetical protein